MQIKAGSMIAFSGHTLQSDLINIGTYGIPRWDIAHVGIIIRKAGALLLVESLMQSELPCVIQGTKLAGVQAHVLEDVLALESGKVYHYPLYRSLYEYESRRLTRFADSMIGRPYDELGALRTAGVGLSWIESWFRPEDLAAIFCSEMVAKAYSTIGILPTNNASRWSPNKLVRRMRRHGLILRPERLK